MHLGKDFWWIVRLFALIVKVLTQLGKDENEDTPEKSDKQICQIQVMFPVDTDEKALELKKNIETLLDETPDAQVHFTLMPLPTMPKR